MGAILTTLTPSVLYAQATADVLNMVNVPMMLWLGLGFAAAVLVVVFRFGRRVNAQVRGIGR